MAHYVYMIECNNGSYYTGYTTDVARRYREHQLGSLKCRYTRSFPPKKLLAFWAFPTRSAALIVECKIKKMSKSKKKLLIGSLAL